MTNPEDPINEEPLEEQGIEPQVIQAETSEKDQLEELQQQVSDFRDKYLRGLADSENLRKRLQKERQELLQYAVQGVVLDFLSPIDHLENALKFADQASDEVKHWALGFQMILGQFKEALSNNGAAPFTSVGMAFDPHCHEAVEMVITEEYSPGTVVEENLRGYKMGDKVIRPARVKVAKKLPDTIEEASEANDVN